MFTLTKQTQDIDESGQAGAIRVTEQMREVGQATWERLVAIADEFEIAEQVYIEMELERRRAMSQEAVHSPL